jgi:hypothetical protein
MKKAVSIVCISILFWHCNGDENKEDKKFFPALSFIQSQVAHVDTSLYRIIAVVTAENISDTIFLKREQFRSYAKDFLNIPDITSRKLRKKYAESKLYEESIDKIIFGYLPKDAKAEIRRQEVVVQPDQQNGDKVKTIFIDQWITSSDSTLQKKMTWEVDKKFRVITLVQKNNQPEKVRKLEVIWNDHGQTL